VKAASVGPVVCALLATVLAAGCGAGASKPSAFATANEMAWLTKLGKLVPSATRCSAQVRSGVGPPPTARLAPAYRLLLRACRAGQHGRSASIMWLAVADLGALGEFQRLPDAAGSYVYGAGGRVARALIGKRVQLRCRSKPDWDRLEAEYTAEGANSDLGRGFEITGFAAIRNGVANLSPDTCAQLHDLTHTPLPQYAQDSTMLEWGEAVTTLAHEAILVAGVVSACATSACHKGSGRRPSPRRPGPEASGPSGRGASCLARRPDLGAPGAAEMALRELGHQPSLLDALGYLVLLADVRP
jgi:hypothetical protein